MSRRTLVLTPGGAVELYEDEALVWCSTRDESFTDEFPDALEENDTADILEYLVEEDYLTETQARRVQCEVEDLDGGSVDEEENENEDEDEDETESAH